jgi:restriction endonuclease S subunit
LKNEISDVGVGLPVMSANVKEPFGFTSKELIPSFDLPSVLWGIDGDWMVNFVPENKPFYPTDHCGVVRIKSKDIHPRYFVTAFEEEGKRVRFSRSNRASMEAINGLRFRVPPIQEQIDFANIVEESENVIRKAQIIITAAPDKKQAILKKYI